MLDNVSNPADAVCIAILANGGGEGDDTRFREWFAGAIKTKTRTTLHISPAQAEIMLETNSGNRTLSMIRAERYGEDMKNGMWMLTGEPIIFSDAGILNDGQTRLKACILSRSHFTTHVTFGIPRRAFAMTGIGKSRGFADVLSIDGEPQAARLAASLNWLNRYLNGWGQPSLKAQKGGPLLQEHPDIRKSIDVGARLYDNTRLIAPSLAIFLHYIFALKDEDQANKFFEYLITSIPDESFWSNDPRLTLRQRLMVNNQSKARLAEMEIGALTIKAWNAFRVHKPVGSLKWMTKPSEGKTPEAFPIAR